MPTQNSEILKNLLFQSNLVGASEIVTMPSSNLTSNTFTQPNGALRSPDWPSNYPNSIQTWTVFNGVAGVYRLISGTLNVESGDHLRVYAGSGITGSILYDTTSSTTGSASNTSFVFCSGVNETFTVAFRSDASTAGSGFSLQVIGIPTTGALSEVGEIRNDNGVLYGRDNTGTFALRQANLGNADVQVFTANGTWNKPATANAVRIFMIGGGGGGGSGRQSASGTAAFGGGGGSGGTMIQYVTMPASVFASTESVVIGTGGTGGAGVSAGNANGATGSNGGTSTFSSSTKLIQALGGLGGGGGTSTAGGAGGAGTQNGDFTTNSAGGAGGAIGAAGTYFFPGGGGGGGSISAALVVTAGGTGGAVSLAASNNVGTQTNAGAATDAFTAGSPIQSNTGYGGIGSASGRPKGGGGGGGGSPNASRTVAGSGGVGGNYGGGGGGGAGSLNGVTSGAGGAGGDGIVVVVSW